MRSLILLMTVFAGTSHAQVVTARLVSSDTLDNPAASTFRKNKGIFLKATRDEDRTTALELVDSTLEIETVSNVFQTALLTQRSSLFAEANVALQNGTKLTTASLKSAEFEDVATSNLNTINLIPVQLIGAYRWSETLRLGLKLIYASAASDARNDFQFAKAEFSPFGQRTDTLTSVQETNSQSNRYTTIGAGAVINLFGTGFSFGAGVDSMELAIDQTVNGVARTTVDKNTTETAARIANRRTITVVKELYGLSYLHESTNFSFRSEFNYQKMPPMDSDSSLKTGELSRGMIEAIWSKFYGGIEASSKRGFFVDPNNLVPIYFSFAHLTEDSVVSYGFFAGFKLSAGGSFGLSYYESQVQKRERLSASDPTQYSIERKTRSFGASYSYVF